MTTITYRGIQFEVDWTYSKSEPQTYDYPGYPETAEILSIKHKGDDIYDFLTPEDLENITEMLLK